jgi:hypothetical protein
MGSEIFGSRGSTAAKRGESWRDLTHALRNTIEHALDIIEERLFRAYVMRVHLRNQANEKIHREEPQIVATKTLSYRALDVIAIHR